MQSLDTYTNFDVIQHAVTGEVFMKISKGWYSLTVNRYPETRMRKRVNGSIAEYNHIGNLKGMGDLVVTMLIADREWRLENIDF